MLGLCYQLSYNARGTTRAFSNVKSRKTLAIVCFRRERIGMSQIRYNCINLPVMMQHTLSDHVVSKHTLKKLFHVIFINTLAYEVSY